MGQGKLLVRPGQRTWLGLAPMAGDTRSLDAQRWGGDPLAPGLPASVQGWQSRLA